MLKIKINNVHPSIGNQWQMKMKATTTSRVSIDEERKKKKQKKKHEKRNLIETSTFSVNLLKLVTFIVTK